MKLSYAEQLKHPNWQRKRLEVMEEAGFACESCGDKDSMLHVHHRRYIKGRMAWDYDNAQLACLCHKCHADEHEKRELLEQLLSTGFGRTEMALGLLAGHLAASLDLDAHEEEAATKAAGSFVLLGAISAMMNCSPARIVEGVKAARQGHELNPAEQCFLRQLGADE